jgi:hypothetical protein
MTVVQEEIIIDEDEVIEGEEG